MPKTLALGTILRMANPATAGMLEIGHLTNITVPSPTKQEIDVTDFDSVAREKLASLPDNGQLSGSGFFNYEDVGQVAALTDAHDPTSPTRDFEIDLTEQDVQFAFSGSILSFAVNAPGPDQAYTFDITITVSGAVTITSPIA